MSGVRPVVLARTYQNQITLPLVSSLSIPQEKGSLIWDPRLSALYVSDGSIWEYIAPGSLSIQDLFSVLSVGNFTGGLNINTTLGSKIVSSDGSIILDSTGSSGPGNILLQPKAGAQVSVTGDETISGLLTSEGNIDTVTGSEIVSSDGNITIDTTSSSGDGKIILIPKGGPDGLVTIDGSLLVTGNTTSLNTESLLIKNNTVYINNGNILTTPLPGFVVVNYLPTVNFATVTAPAFTAGGMSGPTVQTDNAYTFAAGDIVQISSANDIDNDGLFEVNSDVGGLITIRGIGGVSPTFDMFQRDFSTDATAGGRVTKVNVSAASSGSDGLWEINTPGSSTTGMSFHNLATILQNSGTGTISLIFNAATSTLKMLTAGTNISIADSGTGNLTISSTVSNINSSGAGSTSLVFNGATNTLNDLFGGTNISLASAGGRITITNTAPNITSVGTGTSLVFNSAAETVKSLAQGTNITISDNGAGTVTITGAAVSGPYQQVGSLISPITTPVSAIAAGTTNTIATSTNSFIGGGTSNSISNAGVNNSIVGGISNLMNTGTANNCFIAGGNSDSFSLNASAVLNYSCILAGQTNTITVSGAFTVNGISIIGGNTNSITCNSSSSSYHTIVGGFNNSINSSGGNNSIIGGDTGQINIGTSTGCVITAGSANSITGNAASTNNYSSIVAGSSNTITVPGAGITVSGNSIVGGISNTITCSSSSASNNSIVGTTSGVITSSGGNNAIIGGSGPQIQTSGSTGCFIGAGLNNIISGNADGTSVNNYSSIISGSGNTISTPASGATTSGHIIIGGTANTISANNGQNNATIVGSSNTVSGNIGGSLACGTTCSITHSNAFVFSDGSATSSLANQTFTVGAQGGSIFYSNAGRTIGVSLAAGGNSWAAVSDRNLKENITPLDHAQSMKSVSQIGVYRYNFIGNPQEQFCYGTTAQEWNQYFGAENIQVEVIDPITQEPLIEVKPAKDPLKIVQGDVLGILMSCVKYLDREIESLSRDIRTMQEC